MLAPGNAVLASETPSGAGLKVLHLVSRPIKQEKMAPPDQEPEHVCTICGEKSAHKAAFNAHIRAHLKEKLSSKLERRGEQVGQVGQVGQTGSSPRASPQPPPATTVKRKLETCSAPPETIPMHRRIKLELPEVVNHSLLPTLVELQVLEPSLANPPPVFPSPPPSEPDSSLQLSSEFSQEMEMNRVDLNNDLSSILDQIEKDFEAPSLELQDVSLDTPPESDSEQDYFSNLLTPASPEKVLVQRIELPEPSLHQTMVEDHDYLMRNIKQETPPSPDPSPVSSPLSLAKFANLPARAIAVLNQLPGKLVLQKSGNDSKVVNVFKVEKVGPSASSTASTLINIECLPGDQARKGTTMPGGQAGMTNAKIIETTKGADGEKEYKIVLGMERESRTSKVSSGKSKQSAECNICGKSITTKNMARHMEKHTGKKKFQCEICQASFFQKTHLKNHIVLHENGEYHECKDCQQKFLRKSDLQKHQKSVHSIDSALHCSTCGAQFLEAAKLELHRKSHTAHERKELCGLCGEKFEDKESMIAHMEEHTSAIIDRPFTCNVCQKSFAQKGHLNRHIKCHTGESDLVCNVCAKQCKNKADLVQHQARHLTCQACAAVFDSRDSLAEHIVKCHPPAIDMPSSFLSPCSLSSPEEVDFFEEDSNCSSSLIDSSPLDMFQSSFDLSPTCSPSETCVDQIDTLGSFLSDIDSEGPLMSESIGGQKSFADRGSSYPSSNLTLDDISDSSFFDISHQLDEEIYSADLFAS